MKIEEQYTKETSCNLPAKVSFIAIQEFMSPKTLSSRTTQSEVVNLLEIKRNPVG